MIFPQGHGKKIALVRVEGVLFRKGALSLAAYLAANAQGFSERAFKLGMVALANPLSRWLGGGDAALATRVGYYALRNMSEDRLFVLGKEYFDDILSEAFLPEGLKLLSTLRGQGHEIHLFSEGLACALQYLPEHLQEPVRFSCNDLEYSQGVATGKLVDPILGSHSGAMHLIQEAKAGGYDLAQSSAYSSLDRDILLLNSVGHPCVVNPDAGLRRECRQLDWPVMEY